MDRQMDDWQRYERLRVMAEGLRWLRRRETGAQLSTPTVSDRWKLAEASGHCSGLRRADQASTHKDIFLGFPQVRVDSPCRWTHAFSLRPVVEMREAPPLTLLLSPSLDGCQLNGNSGRVC